ncbi:MAG: nitroreductase family protein [Fusobacterium sp. JB019]|nr:nitroreductase family protein [Fusobacterium sp. JB019]
MDKNIFLKNRSYRSFTSRSVYKEELLKMIENARLAASARNGQNIRYALVWEKNLCDEIFPNIAWAGGIKWNPSEKECPRAYIVLCLPNKKNLNYNYNYFDMGIASQNILLTATEMNLGGCILASFNKDKIQQLLNIPENYSCEIMIALGEPAEKSSIFNAIHKETKYYRDEENHHMYVPKLCVKDLIFNK